jgi:hypothetical protein
MAFFSQSRYIHRRTTLRMKQELADRLEAVAKQQNRSIEELLATYIPGFIPALPKTKDEDIEKKLHEFDQFIESIPETNAPPLPDRAISRESIYGDR